MRNNTLSNLNWTLLSCATLLSFIGVVTIFSATAGSGHGIYLRQVYWLAAGILPGTILVILDYSILKRLSYIIYIVAVVLLLLVLFVGHSSSGAQRWLRIGLFSVQPSEFAKLAIIIAIARNFSDMHIPVSGMGIKDLTQPILLASIPFLLILMQPDLGTALTILLISASMAIIVKITIKSLISISLGSIAVLPVMWHYLKDYQKARLLSFIHPSNDPLGIGYNLMQSKIAIGSGGIIGKGFMNSTQGQLLFLPEHHTDFIFAMLAEEWGFIGSAIVLVLYLVLVVIALDIAIKSKDNFGTLLAFGIASMFFWHLIINTGMVTGILPVVGVPLPFLSYGGSFLVVSMSGIALLLNISMRRFSLK